MRIKKFILLVFLLFALNFSFQTAQYVNTRVRHLIVFTIVADEDSNIKEFLSKKEKTRFQQMFRLALLVMIEDNSNNLIFNSS
jgi:hypothetical protein